MKNQEDTLLAERVLSAAINDETGRIWNEKFWRFVETLQETEKIILRKVRETDKEMFYELQKETSVMKSRLQKNIFKNWVQLLMELQSICYIKKIYTDVKKKPCIGIFIKMAAASSTELALTILQPLSFRLVTDGIICRQPFLKM